MPDPAYVTEPGRPGSDVLDLAKVLGVDLMPWQARVLAGMTATRPDGKLAAREALLLCQRQNGKSLVLLVRMLERALLHDGQLIHYSAHEYRSSLVVWNELLALCRDVPTLNRRVAKIRNANAERQVVFDNGSQVYLTSRTQQAGRGTRPDLIVWDEAFAVDELAVAAALPAQVARPDPQLVWASSTGTADSIELLKVRGRLRAGSDPWLAGWEWCADPLDDPGDPAVWAKANPSLGLVLPVEAIARAYATSSPRTFRREHLGIWDDLVAETVFDAADIERVSIENRPAPEDYLSAQLAFGVEIAQSGTTRLSASICAAWQSPLDGVPIVSVIESRPGVDWLPDAVTRLGLRYAGSPIAFDAKTPGGDLLERVQDVELTPITWSDYARGCQSFAQAVVEGRIAICRIPTSLVGEAAAARQKTTGASWVWDRAVPSASLIAATAALWAHSHAEVGVPMIF